MNKSIKRTMGLVLALFVAVSMCVDISGVFADETNTNDQNTKVEAQGVNENEQPKEEENKAVEETKESEGNLEVSEETEAQNNTVAADNGKVYFEILPEIFVKQDVERKNPPSLFASPKETVGVRRSLDVYGGSIPKSEVEYAWGKIAFNVYKDGILLQTTKGTVGNHGRWGGAKYLGPYEKGHNYTVSVDTSTLPTGYYSWITSIGGGAEKWPEDVMTVNNFKVANYDKSNKQDFASFRFHMEIMSFLYAKNEDVAKNQFILNNEGQATGWNDSYQESKDYVLKTIDENGKLVIPTLDEMVAMAREGYRPNGFYSYYIDKDGVEHKSKVDYLKLGEKVYIPFRGSYGYLKWWNDNHGINTMPKFNFSNIYTLVLDQSIPEVTFNRNFDNPNNPNTEIATLNVYYKKSLKNNCIGNECLQKKLPTVPTRDGKVFAGWNTEPDGTGQPFTEETIVTDDITVYAQWEDPKPDEPSKPSEKYYTITVDPNGGNWNGDTAIKTQQFKENEEFKLPEAPTKEGYTFLYWKGSEYQPGQVYVVKEDHKFTAKWKKDEVKPEPENPSDVKTPNQGAEGETKAPSKKSTATNKTPNTGDSAEMMLYAGLTALMSMGALLILKKKRSYK